MLNDLTTPVTENKEEADEGFVSYPPTKPSKPKEVDFFMIDPAYPLNLPLDNHLLKIYILYIRLLYVPVHQLKDF